MKNALLILADKTSLKVYEYYATVKGGYKMRLIKAMSQLEFRKKGDLAEEPTGEVLHDTLGKIDLLKTNMKKMARELNKIMRKYPDIPCYFAMEKSIYHEFQKKAANWMRSRMSKIEGADLTYLIPARLIERFGLSWSHVKRG